MKQLLLICAVVALVGCGKKEAPEGETKNPEKEAPERETKNPELAPVFIVTIDNSIIEAAIRYELEKPTGDLTSADLGKVTKLTISESKLTDVKDLENLTQLKELKVLDNKLTKVPAGLEKLTKLESLDFSVGKLTEVKGLEKLTQLKYLWITGNPDLTKAQIDQLQKALPKCFIHSNPTK